MRLASCSVVHNGHAAKSIIDALDSALAEGFGFTDEELDFTVNYDVKYRMGLKG